MYRLATIGVIRTSDGAHLKRGQPGWDEYVTWQRQGNRPLPMDVPPAPTLTADIIKAAKARIDEAAGLSRIKYLTSVAGQGESYSAKFADAKSYAAAGYPEGAPNHHWVRVEAAETGMTNQEKADQIIAQGTYWHDVVGPAIEGARLAAKKALDTMTTISEVEEHVRAATAAIKAI